MSPRLSSYTAYGELLAIHNATAGIVSGSASALADPNAASTKQLYNGEKSMGTQAFYATRLRDTKANSQQVEGSPSGLNAC